MKKPLRYMLSLVLMLALMLSMGTAAFADKTDSGLPVEYVSYGVGLSDAPGVDKHGLGDDDITIDGVSWRTDTTEDALHVHVLDLAAAKLLRCCADEAKELGLDYAKLYIENGLIYVKEDVPAEEAGGLKEKLDELTRAAVIGLVSGDAFDVGNGGEAKLQVKIATFVTLAQETEAAKSGLDVKGIGVVKGGDSYWDTTIDNAATLEKGMNEVDKIERTTVFIIYGGYTDYDLEADNYSNNAQPTGNNNDYVKRTYKEGWVGIANDKGDDSKYYIKVVGLGSNGSSKYVEVKNLTELDSSKLDPNDPNSFNGWLIDIITGDYGENEVADKIIISTDGTDDGIVMTIDLKDGTATKDEIYGADGKLSENTPTDYKDPTRVDEESYMSYEPKEDKDIEAGVSADTANVTVRDTVTAYDPDATPVDRPSDNPPVNPSVDPNPDSEIPVIS